MLAALRIEQGRIERLARVGRERGDVLEDAGRHLGHVLELHAVEVDPGLLLQPVHHCVVEALLVGEVAVDGALVDAGLLGHRPDGQPCQSRTDEPWSSSDPAAMMRCPRLGGPLAPQRAVVRPARPARGRRHGALRRGQGRHARQASWPTPPSTGMHGSHYFVKHRERLPAPHRRGGGEPCVVQVDVPLGERGPAPLRAR